jgi:hypothetical protein
MPLEQPVAQEGRLWAIESKHFVHNDSMNNGQVLKSRLKRSNGGFVGECG